MRDMLRIMRFDLLSAVPAVGGGGMQTVGAGLIVILLFGVMGMLFSPLTFGLMTFLAMLLVIPLQGMAEKNGFNKLYGILPVDRKAITRGRFLYIFCVFFFSEIIEAVLAMISYAAKLYRLFPNQKTQMMEFVKNSFAQPDYGYIYILAMFAALFLIFSYMEMMGQIFGRESEMKIILITLLAVSALLIGFFVLSDHNIIPTFKLPSVPETFAGKAILAVAVNVLLFGVCCLFSEITTAKVAKREL